VDHLELNKTIFKYINGDINLDIQNISNIRLSKMWEFKKLQIQRNIIFMNSIKFNTIYYQL
jgi:hypothetical protein